MATTQVTHDDRDDGDDDDHDDGNDDDVDDEPEKMRRASLKLEGSDWSINVWTLSQSFSEKKVDLSVL